MCRNIKNLFNFDPPATDEEIRNASLQFVRKVSGFTNPSRDNEEAFNRAIEQTTEVTRKFLTQLKTNGHPKNREIEAQKAKDRSEKRKFSY